MMEHSIYRSTMQKIRIFNWKSVRKIFSSLESQPYLLSAHSQGPNLADLCSSSQLTNNKSALKYSVPVFLPCHCQTFESSSQLQFPSCSFAVLTKNQLGLTCFHLLNVHMNSFRVPFNHHFSISLSSISWTLLQIKLH